MEPKYIENPDLDFLNGTLYLGDGTKIFDVMSLSEKKFEQSYNYKSFNSGRLSCTFSINNIDADSLDKLCREIHDETPHWTMIVEELIQRRRHHKKRINKKWAKKYGYVRKLREIPFCNIEAKATKKSVDDLFGSVTFACIIDANTINNIGGLDENLYQWPDDRSGKL